MTERTAVARLAEWESRDKQNTRTHHVQSAHPEKKVVSKCVLHETQTHDTAQRNEFRKLTQNERYCIIRRNHLCFKCLKWHPSIERKNCRAENCRECGANHHTLLCRKQVDKDENSILDKKNITLNDQDDTQVKTSTSCTCTSTY